MDDDDLAEEIKRRWEVKRIRMGFHKPSQRCRRPRRWLFRPPKRDPFKKLQQLVLVKSLQTPLSLLVMWWASLVVTTMFSLVILIFALMPQVMLSLWRLLMRVLHRLSLSGDYFTQCPILFNFCIEDTAHYFLVGWGPSSQYSPFTLYFVIYQFLMIVVVYLCLY